MLNFGGKRRKYAFFQDKFPLTKNSICSLRALEQLRAPNWKALNTLKFRKNHNFYDFLNYRIFQKLTIEFENHTKRQSETKACVVLDVKH